MQSSLDYISSISRRYMLYVPGFLYSLLWFCYDIHRDLMDNYVGGSKCDGNGANPEKFTAGVRFLIQLTLCFSDCEWINSYPGCLALQMQQSIVTVVASKHFDNSRWLPLSPQNPPPPSPRQDCGVAIVSCLLYPTIRLGYMSALRRSIAVYYLTDQAIT